MAEVELSESKNLDASQSFPQIQNRAKTQTQMEFCRRFSADLWEALGHRVD